MSFLSFSGRATRGEYWRYAWLPFLAVPGVGVIIYVPVAMLFYNWWPLWTFASVFGVAVLIQVVASPLWLGITVRRLHDTGRSAWWLLPYTVIPVGWVLNIVVSLDLDRSSLLGLLIGWYSVIWVLVSWAFVIRLLMLCSGIGTIGPNRYGPQPGVVEESGWGDADLTPPPKSLVMKERTTGIKSVVRFVGALGFGLLAVASAMVLLVGFTLVALFLLPWSIGDHGLLDEYPSTDSCAGGIAVPSPVANMRLVDDCEALLAAKDRLRGAGSLNWSTGTAINSWDGVAIGGTPSRVKRVELDDENLTGSIPASLGTLFEVTHMDLSNNSLRGDIPWELGGLYNLEEIKLSGNSLAGCIPLALKDVATNDLTSLKLPYCQPPPPGALTAGMAGETSVLLSWTAVASISKYRVEYWGDTAGSWTVDDESITTRSHTVDGLQCDTEYRLRVSAYGSGKSYASEWSDPSDALTASTGECVPHPGK